MDKTLHQLGGILLNGLPTFVLVLLLNFYLRIVFFKPLESTLDARYQKTEGARSSAAAALAAAAARVAEHDAALRAARAEVYEAQEKLNRESEQREAEALKAAHHAAEATMREARAQIAAEVETARQALAAQSDALAGEIADSLLKGKAA
jgi:F-type H+-transporting ATPase subunit b